MGAVAIRSVLVMAVYMWLTASSGSWLGLWSAGELVLGIVLSLATGFVTTAQVGGAHRPGSVNPLKWLHLLAYLVGPFMLELARANVDVAYRVITGRIRPGIIRVRTGLTRDGAVVMLANTITLTPGTLTVGVDDATNDLYIHKIHLTEEEQARAVWESRDLFRSDLPAWVRRIAE